MLTSALLAAASLAAAAPVATLEPAAGPPAGIAALAVRVVGRAEPVPGGGWRRQWPGTYFEAEVRGSRAYLRLGAGRAALRVTVDGAPPLAFVSNGGGWRLLDGMGGGLHRLRVDVASESQAGASEFGGIYAARSAQMSLPSRRQHRIEFVGDSYTVGYGNLSPTSQCSEEQVWQTTDTTRGIAPRIAGRFAADYRVNAISGRGVVRNYNGFAADPLPAAYPYTLFDHGRREDDRSWRPQLVVVSLGTNDFSTPLHAGERWADRAALHADYEASYARFVETLHARFPGAYVLLWATDQLQGEFAAETAKVVAQLRRRGDRRVGAVTVGGLAMTACNGHPGLADDGRIADAILAFLAAHPEARAGLGR
ncbi:GDSL family lipase [Sphingomonas ginkgonis]|uniref:GDSL family lipase n=1 Tax=Sphingomonas ginkgonis TaxID=2315330 RepID=A0A429V8H1_9SPHN|nr:SGNH/GDSL hydrolase family protein [Sphingomonas ginkgonis]RST30218.1 GDSL family lipase [Sphingomonas ginkgonis]